MERGRDFTTRGGAKRRPAPPFPACPNKGGKIKMPIPRFADSPIRGFSRIAVRPITIKILRWGMRRKKHGRKLEKQRDTFFVVVVVGVTRRRSVNRAFRFSGFRVFRIFPEN